MFPLSEELHLKLENRLLQQVFLHDKQIQNQPDLGWLLYKITFIIIIDMSDAHVLHSNSLDKIEFFLFAQSWE